MKFIKYPPVLSAIMALLSPALWAQEENEPLFTQPELDQMLAPIALYPDVLLSQVLMAATYPLEVVEASRWSQANPGLEGDEAVRAVEAESWDQSVKTLVGFPDLIKLMDENLTWTRRLGDAFLIQEEQVMATVQDLRSRALEQGSLASLEHVTVEQTAEQIIIEPARVEVVYVPYYSTRIVYGDWWWPNYPPVYWYVRPAYYSSIGISWSRGFRVSTSFYYSSCDWPRHSVVLYSHYRSRDRYDFSHVHSRRSYIHEAPVWRHEPVHRRGVYYRSGDLNTRYDRKRYADTSRTQVPNRRVGEQRDRDYRSSVPDRAPDRRTERVDRNRPPSSTDRVDRTPPQRSAERVPPNRSPDQISRPDRPNQRERSSVVAKPPRDRPTRESNPPARTAPPPVKTAPVVSTPPVETSRSTVTNNRNYQRGDDARSRMNETRDRGRRSPIADRDP